MSSPEVVALMLADGRLPTGGHTQSAGLEPAVRAGLGADGKHLASGGADREVRVWDLATKEKGESLPPHPAGVSALAAGWLSLTRVSVSP